MLSLTVAGEPDVAAATGGDQLDDLGGVGVLGHDLGGYPSEVQRRDPVGDLHHVVHVVRDQYDAAPLVGQAAYEVQDLAGLGHTERRGRLVEEDHLAVPEHRLGDCHGLALTARQVGHRAGAPTRRCAPTGSPASRVPAAPSRRRSGTAHPTDLPAEEHVLGDVEVVGQGEILVDELDPESGGGARVGDRHRLPLEGDLAAVEAVDAGDALHQRRLPGAVVTDQRRDLARDSTSKSTSWSTWTGPKLLFSPLIERIGSLTGLNTSHR